jgi:hypothetical protein
MDEISALEQKCRKSSLEAMPEEIRLLDEVLLHTRHGIGMPAEFGEDLPRDFLEMTLLSRALGSCWRAREDALCGYYLQCYVLCRAAFEDVVTFVYVQSCPDKAILWVRDSFPDIEAPGRVPRFREMWAHLDDAQPGLGERFKDFYGILSEYTHPRHRGLQSLWELDTKPSGEETHRFWMLSRWNPDNLKGCLGVVLYMAGMLMGNVEVRHRRFRGKPISEWAQRANELVEEIERTERRKRFSVIKADDIPTPEPDAE